MNERIRELVRESNLDVYGLGKERYRWEYTVEKFAELIVRECVAQIEIEKGNPYRNMGDENRYGIGACVESIRRIKQHFGVK